MVQTSRLTFTVGRHQTIVETWGGIATARRSGAIRTTTAQRCIMQPGLERRHHTVLGHLISQTFSDSL